MPKKAILLFVIISFLFAGCNTAQKNTAVNGSQVTDGNTEITEPQNTAESSESPDTTESTGMHVTQETISIFDLEVKEKSLTASIKVPYITYKDKKVEEKINNELSKFLTDNKKELQDMAKEVSFVEDSYVDNGDYRDVQVSYTEEYNRGNILSLMIDETAYTGGAHSNTTRYGLNFDLTTGDRIVLKDLFKDKSTYKTTIKNTIAQQIQQNPDKYDYDTLDLIQKEPLKEDDYYITDKGLVFFYQDGDVAGVATGILQFLVTDNLSYQ